MHVECKETRSSRISNSSLLSATPIGASPQSSKNEKTHLGQVVGQFSIGAIRQCLEITGTFGNSEPENLVGKQL
jgi:hypothetical protein